MKLLGVDDNPDILKFVQMTVEMMGHEFNSAGGGKEGLEKIRTREYDMVFLDLSMPDFSGLDVIDALEKDGILRECNIILFTASYLGVSDLEKSLSERGVLDVLTKPADIDQIMEKIQQVEDKL